MFCSLKEHLAAKLSNFLREWLHTFVIKSCECQIHVLGSVAVKKSLRSLSFTHILEGSLTFIQKNDVLFVLTWGYIYTETSH